MAMENRGNNRSNIEIKMKLKGKGRLLATFALTLRTAEFGKINIKGFRIIALKDSDDLWIEPPSYMSLGKYHKFVFFEQQGSWEMIKAEAVKEYRRLLEAGETQSNMSEDIDPREIPDNISSYS